MKRLFAIALAVCMVFGMAAIASAVDMQEHHPVFTAKETEISLSGDARVRGLNTWNKDGIGNNLSNLNTDDVRLWDSRIRVKLDVKNGGGATAHVRLVFDEGMWAGNGNSTGTPGSTQAGNTNVVADWAYVTIPVGPAKFTIGDQRADWGNKFWVWDEPRHRVKVTGKVGNVTVGALTDKVYETSLIALGGEEVYRDEDDWALLAITNMGDVTVGVIGVYWERNRRNQNPDGSSTPVTDGSEKQWAIDPYFKAKAGPVALTGEVVYMNNFGHKPNFGIYTDATMAAGPVTVKAVGAHADGGYTADDDWIPVNLIGTDNPWAVMNFGGQICTGVASSSGCGSRSGHNEGKSQTLAALAASMKPLEWLTVAVDGAYVWDELQHNGMMGSIAGVMDVTKGVTWTVLAGAAKGDDSCSSNNGWGRCEGDAYVVLGHELDMTF